MLLSKITKTKYIFRHFWKKKNLLLNFFIRWTELHILFNSHFRKCPCIRNIKYRSYQYINFSSIGNFTSFLKQYVSVTLLYVFIQLQKYSLVSTSRIYKLNSFVWLYRFIYFLLERTVRFDLLWCVFLQVRVFNVKYPYSLMFKTGVLEKISHSNGQNFVITLIKSINDKMRVKITDHREIVLGNLVRK